MSDVWLNIVMVFVFVLIGGAFSGAEIALVSLRESQVRAMAENEGRRGKAVQRLLSDPNRFLAAVQVGVTLAGFFSAAFGASTLSAPLPGGCRAGASARASRARWPWSSSPSRSATSRSSSVS